jgi:hypothetical protein
MSDFFCCSKYKDYKNIWQNNTNSERFREFISFTNGNTLPNASTPYAVQAVVKQDFGPVLYTKWYIREGNGFKEDDTNNSSREFLRSNDFKNYKCARHCRYFELNLYTQDGVSHHHESTRSGRDYFRDARIDQGTGICTKGAHWTHPTEKST